MSQTAQNIYNQLGGNKFRVMTGSKNFLFAEISDTCPAEWLRMDLSRNASGCNRLKIIYDAGTDTYVMKFYRQQIKNYTEVVISKEQTFNNVYAEMLGDIFTDVTKLDTRLF